MKIYEHISKELQDVSSDGKKVKMYVCGPTVYNHVHIGNIRPIITFDVFNRLLIELGYNVEFIHNITDIDDKIIDRAKIENKDEMELSKFYADQYQIVLDNLNIKKDNMLFPKVSENIVEMENYIKLIIEKEFAYEVNGDVYFDTSKIKDYGSVSGKDIEELEVGEKSLKNESKKNDKDFVLWKKTETGLNWKTCFSEGRPGWHTECACLVYKYFNDQCDIHGGGVDLKFPHHENENAQNIAVSNKGIARIWMHVGHLNINEEKMSKSLNNFILAKELLEKFDSNHIRWFFYQTSFTNPINFTSEIMNDSKNTIDSILKNLNIFKSYLILEDMFNENIQYDKKNLVNLENNFNFPNTVTLIMEEIKKCNNLLRIKEYENLNYLRYQLEYLLKNILGITINNIHTQENISILKKWDQLKKEKKYEEADNYRKTLIERNLI